MRTRKFAYLNLISIFTVSLLTPVLAPAAFAATLTIQNGANAARGTDQSADLFGATGVFTTISNLLLFLVGAISVIMIIIGGLRYVISGGNSSNVTAAKNTILYAIVGLIVAILAFAIINFVVSSFAPNGATNNI